MRIAALMGICLLDSFTSGVKLWYFFLPLLFSEEVNLPADIPSYLSSQGTLSEPQEGYSNSEAGSNQQLMPPANGYVHKSTEGKSWVTWLQGCKW